MYPEHPDFPPPADPWPTPAAAPTPPVAGPAPATGAHPADPADPYAAYATYAAYGVGAPPPGGPSRRERRMSRSRRRVVTTLAVLAFLAIPAIAGYEVGKDGGADAGSASAVVPGGTTQLPSTDGGSGTGGSASGSSTGSGSAASADLAAVADEVDDVVVNINSEVDGGGLAAGTGIIISSDGLAITNNHVIAETTGLTVEISATGATRPAKLLGYSVVDDIALIQIQNVSNLKYADIGTSSSLAIGETVLALGNAGGVGGEPSIVSGTVTALEQEITASDSDGSNSQTLEGLVQLAADIRSGDSGGPIVDTDGRVVGVTVAASVANGFGFGGQASGGEGYAIPIEDAIAVVKKITSGEGGENIRIGDNRAVLGVSIQPTLTNQRVPGGSSSSTTGNGVQVIDVQGGSGADDAGIEAGSTIVAIGGRQIGSLNDITRALIQLDPGEKVEVTWRDASGQTRTAQVVLGEGPPA